MSSRNSRNIYIPRYFMAVVDLRFHNRLGSASVGDLFPDFSAIHKKKANCFRAKKTFSATFGE